MKTTLMLSLLMLSLTVWANDPAYYEAMGQQIKSVYTAQSIDELLKATNALDRIAEAEKTKWEPRYYGAFGYIMMANREQDPRKKDGYLDQALERVKSASELGRDNSEVLALEGFVHMLRVSVDPASRGQRYSGMSMTAFGKALKANPNNPRALALMAQMQYGTAQFFGSSTAEPCGMAEKALALFATEKNENPLDPRWGKEMTERTVKNCKP